MQENLIAQFRKNLRGRLIERIDSDYDELRKLHNGMIDKRPLLIARCVDVGRCCTRGGLRPGEQAPGRDPRWGA